MILVTGATGRLGGHVVRALRRMGQPVRALVRKGSEYFWLNDSGAAYFFGDLREPRSLERACKGARYLIAASGIEHETRENDHRKTTVAGHTNLWSAAARQGVSHVVYVSALGVDRGYPIPWFDAKLQAEAALAASGVPWTALRPAPYSRWFAELGRRAARRGGAWLPGPGHNRVAPVAVSDVALYAVAALDLPEWRDRAVEIGGLDVLGGREAADRAAEAAGGGRLRPVPAPAARLAARLVRPIGRRWEHQLLHKSRWLTDDFAPSMDEVVAATGIEPKPFDQAIAEDLAEILPRESADAREERVVHRKFEATVYEPGEVPLASLPDGPLRYEDPPTR